MSFCVELINDAETEQNRGFAEIDLELSEMKLRNSEVISELKLGISELRLEISEALLASSWRSMTWVGESLQTT